MKVVFIFNEFSLHNHIIDEYCEERPNDIVSIVKVPLVLRGKTRSETASRVLPKLSKRFIWSKFKESLVVSLITFLPKLLGRGATFRRLRWIASRRKLPFHKSHDVMSKETLAFLAAESPDIIVTLFHQIIREDLIKIPRLGVVNVHPGILPNFRGIQPYFWELMEGFGKGGVTLHLIEDASIDTGRILGQAKFASWPNMSVQLNYYLTSRSAAYLLPKVISVMDSGNHNPIDQDPNVGKYYRWPDTEAVDQLVGKGHPIVNLSDLIGILTGRFDHFIPCEIEIYQR